MDSRLPEQITLTEAELLRLENLALRISTAKKDLEDLYKVYREIEAEIEKRLGIDSLKLYDIDRTTGKGLRIKQFSETTKT